MGNNLSESQVEDDSPSSPVEGHISNEPLIMIRPNQTNFDDFKHKVEENCGKFCSVWQGTKLAFAVLASQPQVLISAGLIFFIRSAESISTNKTHQFVYLVRKWIPRCAHDCQRAETSLVSKQPFRGSNILICNFFRQCQTATSP